jgi:glycosyltransferase involved in cell wall biosynthesis
MSSVDMKVALVHDYIKEYGGAERVLEVLHEIFPDAPVYTSVYLPSYLGPHRERFADWKIRTSWAQYLPLKAKLISPIRILSPWLFKQFDFSAYDVVIVSASGAYFPNSIRTKNDKRKTISKNHSPYHICYCHTPPRYLYGYATAREWKKNKVMNVVGVVANHFLRIVDFNASKNVDQYIANSEEVKRRIAKFYRQDAVVIYPPIEIPKHKSQAPNKSQNTKYQKPDTAYFLAGGRLARPKHIDLIIKACMELDVPLKVFGKAFAGYGEELEAIAKSDKRKAKSYIEFLGEVTNEEKWELLADAKAYVFASEDEDFGILPVEAMAAGTPVIAYRSGGVQETVIEGITGLFFDELSVESLKRTIKEFEKQKFNAHDISKRAEEFSENMFQEKIKKLVTQQVSSSVNR